MMNSEPKTGSSQSSHLVCLWRRHRLAAIKERVRELEGAMAIGTEILVLPHQFVKLQAGQAGYSSCCCGNSRYNPAHNLLDLSKLSWTDTMKMMGEKAASYRKVFCRWQTLGKDFLKSLG